MPAPVWTSPRGTAVERLRSMVAGIGGFGGQFPLDMDRYTRPVLVASTDGVGTKLVVARDSGRYETVGIDLVAMCVDDLVCVGAGAPVHARLHRDR